MMYYMIDNGPLEDKSDLDGILPQINTMEQTIPILSPDVLTILPAHSIISYNRNNNRKNNGANFLANHRNFTGRLN